MTVGLNSGAGGLARLWLNVLSLQSITTLTNVYAQLHTSAGDPGAAGTSNVSSTTTRQLITFGTTTTGTISSSNAPQWTSWAGTNGEVVRYISLWTASTAGTFLCSIQLTADKTMGTGDTLTLTSGATTVSLTPIAA